MINDFINQNPNMDYDELATEFKSMDFGKHKRIELSENVSSTDPYFFRERDRVLLTSGQTVCISHLWGVRGVMDSRTWDKFQDHMRKRGYSIGNYRIFNINDGAHRNWEYCRRYNFISAGGKKRYHTGMNKLQKGDLLFICRVDKNLSPAQRGCVAYCRVVSEEAINVEEITTPKGKLKDTPLNDGRTYYDTFCKGKKFPDKAVKVEWISLREDSPVHTGTHPGLCVTRMAYTDFVNLTNAFKIPRDNHEK